MYRFILLRSGYEAWEQGTRTRDSSEQGAETRASPKHPPAKAGPMELLEAGESCACANESWCGVFIP